MIPLILAPAASSVVCALTIQALGLGPLAAIFSAHKKETERTSESTSSAMDKLKDMDMDQLVSLLVEKIEHRSPELVKAIQCIDKDTAITETLHLTYFDRIASAQAYLNENHQADFPQVQCLLRKMLPEPYHKAIADLRENQDPSIIYNIFWGVHQHATNATKAEQKSILGDLRHAPRILCRCT